MPEFAFTARILTAAMAILALSGPAAAQIATERQEVCEMKQDASYQEVVTACTAILQARDLSIEARATALAFRARAYVELEQNDAAVRDATEALELKPGGDEFAFTRGRAYLNLGKGEEAAVEMTRALSDGPGQWEVLMYRAMAYQMAGDVMRAGRDFDAAVADGPRQPEPWFMRAHFRYEQGDRGGAVADLSRTYELDGKSDVAVRMRAEIREQMKDFDRAIADADLAVRLAPHSALNQNAKCWVRASAGRDLATARAACDESLRLAPGEPETLDSRGLVGLRQGRHQDAWNDYDAAVRVSRQASYLYGRGLAALRLGRIAAGQADLAAARELDPQIAAVYADKNIRP